MSWSDCLKGMRWELLALIWGGVVDCFQAGKKAEGWELWVTCCSAVELGEYCETNGCYLNCITNQKNQ